MNGDGGFLITNIKETRNVQRSFTLHKNIHFGGKAVKGQ